MSSAAPPPSASTAPAKTYSVVAFLKRKPGLTPDEFYHHWVNVHGPLVRPWAVKHGFLEYRQIHLKPAVNADRPVVGPEKAGVNTELQNWDGCATFELASLDAFTAAFQDPYYQTVIAKDEDKFVDKAAGVMRRYGELNRIV
ncbi:Dimeric alpha-beta barrel [Niveomyces insectorum RCEF 264]|uniref:Dimeric alpha-beta barrel n=1 Tax=Niveomyces insectorum RCEF 264 TaxID=1081102 RepID=A0A167RIH4_9HYPO|nr:Dimeric alpha-beta barrel [Niveomyces insectorum RCEF 264]